MTLHRKTLLIMTTALVSLYAMIYFTASRILLEGFAKLEQQETREDIQRAQAVLSINLTVLNQTTDDWAGWDDTYRFIQDGNRAYHSNFVDAGLASIRLNLILFVQPSGHIVYGTGFDMNRKVKVPLAPELRTLMADPQSLPLRRLKEKESKTGILLLAQGPMLIAARPILTNEKKGPPRGTLIFGRNLDDAEIQRIGSLFKLPISIKRLDTLALPPDFEAARKFLSVQQPSFVSPLNDSEVGGYALLNDVFNRPCLLMRVNTERDVYQQGMVTIGYLLSSLLLVSLIFGGLSLLLLERGVLQRLTDISTSVKHICVTGNIGQRLPVTGQEEKDELADLVIDINGLLAAVQEGQRQLESNERLYRQMAFNASDVLFVVLLESREVQWYGQIDELLGYDDQEFPRTMEAWENSLHPDDRDRVIAAYEYAYESGSPICEEYRIRRKDGVYLYWMNRGLSVRDEYGDIDGFIGACSNITERKLFEEELSRSREKLMAALRASRLRIWEWHIESNTVSSITFQSVQNDLTRGSFPQSLEAKSMEMTLDRFIQSLHPSDQSRLRQTIIHAVATGTDYEEEFRYIEPDGQLCWLQGTGQVVRDETGRAIRFIGAVADISARKKIEEDLRHSRARLEEAQAMAHLGNWEWDLTNDTVVCSDELYNILGIEKGEFDGTFKGYLERVQPQDREQLLKLDNHGAMIPGTFLMDHRIVRPDGTIRALQAQGIAEMDEMGKVVRLHGMAQDITEQVEAEEVLRSSREHEQQVATLLRGVLAAADELLMCHEIDTILCKTVELAREHLGVERCGIAVLIPESQTLASTYGTDMNGRTTREYGYHFNLPSWLRSHPQLTGEDQSGWACFEDQDLFEWDGTKTVAVGHGWLVATVIHSTQGLVGVLFNDTAITGKPMDNLQQEILAIYCSLVGNIMEHKQTEAQLKQVTAAARCLLWRAYVVDEGDILNWDTVVHNPEAAVEFLPLAIPPGGSYSDAFFAAMLEEEWPRLHQTSATALRTGKHSYTQEYRLRLANNQVRWVAEDVRIKVLEPGRWELTGVCTDITARKSAETARQVLLRRLVTAQEEERLRIARELHDQIGQESAALLLGLKSLPGQEHLPERLANRVHELQELTLHLMQQTRRLALDLRPETLDKMGLSAALKRHVQEWSERFGVDADFHCRGQSRLPVSNDVQTTIYRVVQEALTNVARHAEAQQVSVLVDYREDHILTIVEDDGLGFEIDDKDNESVARGLGLVGMQERVALVNGTLKIESHPGAGTSVFIRIPIVTGELNTAKIEIPQPQSVGRYRKP